MAMREIMADVFLAGKLCHFEPVVACGKLLRVKNYINGAVAPIRMFSK